MMKAVLFSNFPEDVYQNTLKPKFDQARVEILRVVSADKGLNQRCDDADVLVAMIELMSGGQRERVKKLAKQLGKPFVALYRKGAVWEKSLGKVVQRFEDAQKKPLLSLVGPSSSRQPLANPVLPADFDKFLDEEPASMEQPVAPAYSVEEMQELLDIALEEVEKLSNTSRISHEQFDEKTALIDKLKLERNQMAAAFRRTEEANQALEKGVAKLRSDLADAERGTARIQKENTELLKENNEWKEWKVSAAKAASGRAMSEQAKDVQELSRRNKALQEKIDRAEQSLKLAQDEISVNRRKVTDADVIRTNESVKDGRIGELETQLEEWKERVKKAEKFVNSAKAEVERAHSESEGAVTLNKILAEVRTQAAKDKKELETQKAKNKNQEEELVRLRTAKPLPLAPPGASAVKKTEDFVEVRNAFKALWRAGAMDHKEILEKLMAWEPKES